MAFQGSLYNRRVICIDSRSRDNFSNLTQVWAGPGTVYLVNDLVLVNSIGYICLVGHISATVFTTDLAAGFWQLATVSSPSRYTVKFPGVRNVKMLRLLTAEMPNTQYVINHKNRWVDFFDTLTATAYSAPLYLGTYTSTSLSNEINTRMNDVMGAGFGVNFTVSYNSVTQKFIITRMGGTTFQLLWRTGPNGFVNTNMSAAPVLGWSIASDTATAITLTSPGLVNLAGENFCNLCIKGYPAMGTSEAIGDVFAKIIWNQIPRNVCFNSFASNAIIYPNAKSYIDNFEVSFVEFNGQLYDFNNADHSFSVEFFCEN